MNGFSSLSPGTYRGPCPTCNRGPRDTALAVSIAADGDAVWYCHRCQQGGGLRTQPRAGNVRTAQRPRELSDYGRALWDSARPIHGVAHSYLTARCCALPPEDGDLRCAELQHPSGYKGPALVALVTDAVTNKPLSLHRTWIRADGQKAAVNPPRLLLKGHSKRGGVIRLWPDECIARGLGISEGIENALVAANAHTPMWSGIDAANMAALPVLSGVEALTVFSDHDSAGIRSSSALAKRWADAGREVLVVMPPTLGADLADAVSA